MTNYNFGEIVLVPFPFTDQTGTKKRPAVIVSSAFYNVSLPDVILMAVTSQVRKPLKAGEIEIIDWQNAGLLKSSVIKPVITTIEKKLILRKLGELEKNDEENLKIGLQNLIGL
jgi:mRNA interferase MazF